MLDPAFHHVADGLLGNFFKRFPEILTGGIVVFIGFEVVLQTLFKIFGTDIAFDLPQDAAALAVDNRSRADIDNDMLSTRKLDGKIFEECIPRHGTAGACP